MKFFVILAVIATAVYAQNAQAPPFQDEWSPMGYEMNFGSGQVAGRSTRQHFGQEAIMRAEFRFAGVTCSFGIEGRFENKNPYAFMKCNGTMTEGARRGLIQAKSRVADRVTDICGEKVKMCPPNFLFGMMDYISQVPQDQALPYWEKKINIQESTPEDGRDPDGSEGDDRKRSHTCNDGDSWTNRASLKYPNSNEPNCPAYTSVTSGGNGAKCICPYSGSRTAYYDAKRYGTNKQMSWVRYLGTSSNQCTGRCGAGCNSADKEAYIDCFDHDSCVDHVGGSSFTGNDAYGYSSCGDEFNEAADDYVASYGYCCCTCNIWIGCFC